MRVSICFLIALLIQVASVAYSQAIYLSANDFVNRKTTHLGKNTRIKLHEVFNTDVVEVKVKDSVFSYRKTDIFGFVNKDGAVSRFYENEIYPILNPSEKILIYSLSSGSGFKNSPIIQKYFFSKDAGAEILPLTLRNIELSFKEEPEFTKAVELYFKSDAELVQYDYVHNKYKLNRLLELTTQMK